ncbi:tetraspanin-11-like protein [Dinothrombium tinctorium]|uniref:Tetraspanin n=1 Tax=Dinothrombium tinctorium TaxID=1965070 RepID=A0A443QUL7_9ACAR|nr:tetraspanin-11-like protein [Dinothrombium tinctorium]RWS06691.1 tetraspanin-11-like protein [Dinothrombium tinctorium]
MDLQKIGGIVVFAVGVWTLSDKSFMERLLGTNHYIASAAILIGAGIIVSIISFLGTIGAYKEIKCILVTYFIILFMLFVVMLVGGILGYVFRSEVDERMHSEMVTTVRSYGNDTSITDAWDAVQKTFNCCGIVTSRGKGTSDPSYGIWENNPNFNRPNGPRVPISCCKNVQDDNAKRQCQGQRINPTQIHTEGCYEKMKDFVKGHALLIAGIAIGIACVLIIGMILSCALYLMIQ